MSINKSNIMNLKMENRENYPGMNGLRAYSIIGIVMGHVLSNGNYGLSGILYQRIIPSLMELVFLFMIISAFSMSCGYYEKMVRGKISLEQFYIKRYKKIWPLFAVLCTLDLIMNPSVNSLYEYLADLTLAFGFIPNAKIEIIGVGWFLGLVFVFYMIFPFYCFLISSKKRAWLAFAVSILINLLCLSRFTDANDKFLMTYSAMYFFFGGILFIYREEISRTPVVLRIVNIVVIPFAWILTYCYLNNSITKLVLYGLVATIAIHSSTNSLLSNKLIDAISKYGLEIYLIHMVVFRVLERMNVIHLFRREDISYFAVVVMTFGMSFIIAVTIKRIGKIIHDYVYMRKTR